MAPVVVVMHNRTRSRNPVNNVSPKATKRFTGCRVKPGMAVGVKPGASAEVKPRMAVGVKPGTSAEVKRDMTAGFKSGMTVESTESPFRA